MPGLISYGASSPSALDYSVFTLGANLTTPESWTLIPAPLAEAETTPPPSVAAPVVPCPITAYDEPYFLAMFDRLFPTNYLTPIKTVGPGYEVFQAFATQGARLSTSVANVGCDSFILTAQAGAFATGTVQLFRSAPIPDGVTTVIVRKGTAVITSRSGRIFLTTTDVTFAPAALGPFTVGVIALAVGYDFNVPGQVLAADGESLPGDIDTMDKLVETPDYGDPTIQVSQAISTSGGQDASLDQHGIDRGIPRNPGEQDTPYKIRIRTLPDTISPDAVDRAVKQAFLAVQASASFAETETWDITYQTCWDAPSAPIAGSNFNPSLFVYDDPRPPTPFMNRWLDENDFRGGFFVTVPNFQPLLDFGMQWFDPIVLTLVAIGGQSGSVASISAKGTTGQNTFVVSGLTGMASASVGTFLTLSGCASSGNNGSWLITKFVSTSSVEIFIQTGNGVEPDANNGSIAWTQSTRTVTEEATPTSLISPLTGGQRAASAFDESSNDTAPVLDGCYDGYDARKNAVYAGLFNALQNIKAAGVSATIELQGQ